MSKEIEEKNFCTSDIAIAAFLVTKGHKLIKADRDSRGQFFFNFKEEESIQSDVISFLSSECFAYDNNMRMLRSLVKSI